MRRWFAAWMLAPVVLYLLAVALVTMPALRPAASADAIEALVVTAPWSIILVVIIDKVAPSLHASDFTTMFVLFASALLNATLLYLVLSRRVGRRAHGAADDGVPGD